MERGSEKRKVREAVLETFAFSTGALVIVFVLSGYGLNEDVRSAFERAVATGKLLHNQFGWILTSYLTVLMAFYAVIIGGQVWGSRHEVRRVRHTLGVVAELMVASLAPIFVFLVAYCVAEPFGWAIFLGVGPVMGIVLFLGVQLGSFVVFDRDARYKLAEEKVMRAGRLLPQLKRRPRQPVWLILTVNSALLAVFANTLSWPSGSVGRWFALAGTYFAMGLIVELSLMLPNCERLLRGGRQMRKHLILVPVLTLLLCAAVAAVLIFDSGGDPALVRRGMAILVFIGCLLVSGTLSVHFSPRLFAWSVRAAGFKLAASWLASDRLDGRKEMRELDGRKPRGFYQKLDTRFDGGATNFHA